MGRDHPADSRIEFRFGPVLALVTFESIERVLEVFRPDAVVSSDDSQLSHGGGVSAAIAANAGPLFAHELEAHVPAEVGTIVVTSPGRLPVQYVLHAITVDWAKGILPNERTIRQLGREIFMRCESLAIRSVAVPALATGAAKFAPDVCAELVADALHDHVRNSTKIERVVFSLPDPETHLAFSSHLASLAARDPGMHLVHRARSGFDDLLVSGNRETLAGSPASETARRSREASEASAARDGQAGDPGSAARPEVSQPVHARRRAFPWLGRKREDPSDRSLSKETLSLRSIPVSPAIPRQQRPALPVGDSRPVLDRRYVLLEEIGRGAFAVVHLAWDLVLRRTIAIKRLREDVAIPDSLVREAAIALDLAHEGIVRVHHFEPRREAGGPFLVMEYLSWPSGEKWMADAGSEPLPTRTVLAIGATLCGALAFAHDRGVLHLDIKPSNIFVDPAAERTKLADFGIAGILQERAPRAVQLRVSGTPAYMAPEQREHGGLVSVATDIYQLAATLWDFLTGSPPKFGELAQPVANRDSARGVALQALASALAPDPARRPPNAGVFAERLRAM